MSKMSELARQEAEAKEHWVNDFDDSEYFDYKKKKDELTEKLGFEPLHEEINLHLSLDKLMQNVDLLNQAYRGQIKDLKEQIEKVG